MRFMTFDWWAGGCQDSSVIDAYWSYFNSVADRLPGDAARLHREFTLHDSELRGVRIETASQRAAFELEGFDIRLEQSLRYSLTYLGVESIELAGVSAEPLRGPGGLGQLGYDEFELLESGLTEHRMLFSTGTELTLTFRDLRLVTQPGMAAVD
jgi:hypothetical protein